MYHAVYIEQDRKSSYYKMLTDFSFDEFWKEQFIVMYKLSTQTHGKHAYQKHTITGFPQKWLPLFVYKGKYYLYWGSKTGSHILSDTAFISIGMEGPEPHPIASFTKTSPHTYKLKTKSLVNTSVNDYDEYNIYVIDTVNMVSIWQSIHEPAANQYKLMIPASSAKNYELVVDFCKTQKQLPFKFDAPDYQKLLKKR